MSDLLADPQVTQRVVEEYGSPVNVLHTGALAGNASDLSDAAAELDIDLRVFFARKANKALSFVDAARDAGLGVDVASENELRQVLDRGVQPHNVIVTAAVKPPPLLELCLSRNVPVALDNHDEADGYLSMLAARGDGAPPAPVALRIASQNDAIAPTRFGMSVPDWLEWLDTRNVSALLFEGVHFHLHGYSPHNRAIVVDEALQFIDALRQRGHRPSFIDMGGGIPMSYLNNEAEWDAFEAAHKSAILHQRPPITWRNDGFGRREEAGALAGTRNTYPYFQRPIRGDWLRALVAAHATTHTPNRALSTELRDRGLHLRCEPGRSLLDGCGMTLAKVLFRKKSSDGIPLVGLEMNRTQCRSTSADFLVDPILVRGDQSGRPNSPFAGFLVGAYCVEDELILRRKLNFPHGVAVGDIVALPNTAGYLMHILESESHQLPLARNIVVRDDGLVEDDIGR
ncbi:Y4yA family PLP-dependent enzyme [Hoyosella rhizosphaerae]|nr:Y4yA family PLP-dependent enzyme [Hoyosella rhizosphaerae]